MIPHLIDNDKRRQKYFKKNYKDENEFFFIKNKKISGDKNNTNLNLTSWVHLTYSLPFKKCK